jgi:TolA-binding protein
MPQRPAPLILTVALLAWPAGGPRPLAAPDDVASRQLENGDRLARDGKQEQAEAAWHDVVARYPDSIAAPQALDRLGSAAFPAEDLADLGRSTVPRAAAARAAFERIAADYRASRQAARANLKLALLFADPMAGAYDLDEAYARYSAVVHLYPDSDLVDDALFGMGTVLATQGAGVRALAPLERLAADWPASPLAERAHLLGALCLTRAGRLEDAALELQSLRRAAPESPLASEARERLTHLVRLIEARRPGGSPAYTRHRFLPLRVPAESSPRAIASMAAGEADQIVIADQRDGAVLTLDPGAALIERQDVPGAAAVWTDRFGTLIAAGGDLIRQGRRSPLTPRPGEEPPREIDFISRDGQGRLTIHDAKSGEILRYHPDLTFEKRLVGGKERRVDALAAAPDGALCLLDGRAKTVSCLLPSGGEERITLAPVEDLDHPDGLAIDFVGDFVVLDRGEKLVAVFDPAGAPLARIRAGDGAEPLLWQPGPLCVNLRGQILVFDQRQHGLAVLE